MIIIVALQTWQATVELPENTSLNEAEHEEVCPSKAYKQTFEMGKNGAYGMANQVVVVSCTNSMGL